MEDKVIAKTSLPTQVRNFVEFSHTFTDPWGPEGEDTEVTLKFRFAKPNKIQIKRLQDTAGKNAAQASRNILLETVHADDKDALTGAMEDYPGLATTFSTVLIKGVGIAQELGK